MAYKWDLRVKWTATKYLNQTCLMVESKLIDQNCEKAFHSDSENNGLGNVHIFIYKISYKNSYWVLNLKVATANIHSEYQFCILLHHIWLCNKLYLIQKQKLRSLWIRNYFWIIINYSKSINEQQFIWRYI